MNPVRIIIAIVVVAVFFCAFEWTFHGLCMAPIYERDPAWLRDPAGTQEQLKWMFVGVVSMAAGFVLIWALGFGARGVFHGLLYGLCLAILGSGEHLLNYHSQPIPEAVIARWIIARFIEFGLGGILTALIYRPKKALATVAGSQRGVLSGAALRKNGDAGEAQ